MEVEVVYATAERQWVVTLVLLEGATIADALTGAEGQLADLDTSDAVVGVYGTVRSRHDLLKDGDRVEIYRPLRVDAKEARRRRASDQKRQGQEVPR